MNHTVAQSAPGVQIKRTALVVDDVDDMLDLLEIALNAADFVVLRASSAAEAMDLFGTRGEEIDLLMTDLQVGTESGIELARRLTLVKPSLHVLAMSGFALEGQVITPNAKIEFLPKPFSTSELKSKLSAIFPPSHPGTTVTVSGDPNTGSYTYCATSVTENKQDPLS